ncbi:hypothetical protein NE237_004200 [Protea cynaroides]|uniref:Uncharacterized protein n=1 Tax=Protea cynaroides TaxID=273540 RepID=A0A9Q0KIY2_9MAGN|nr:hypothetical protein NE237_004200 [Protea cynaroides]
MQDLKNRWKEERKIKYLLSSSPLPAASSLFSSCSSSQLLSTARWFFSLSTTASSFFHSSFPLISLSLASLSPADFSSQNPHPSDNPSFFSISLVQLTFFLKTPSQRPTSLTRANPQPPSFPFLRMKKPLDF